MNTHQYARKKFVVRATTAMLSLFLVVGNAAAAASLDPALLVNTQSHETIHDGNGVSNIELRFGQTLQQKLYYDRGNQRFGLTNGLFVGGGLTATGALAGSGNLSIGGNAKLKGTLNVTGASTFGSTINIGGVTYTFPGSDGSASGKVLKTDGNGKLSWSNDIDTDTDTNSQTLCSADQYLDGDGNCVDVIEEGELNNEATLETQLGGINVLTGTELDSLSELETQVGGANIITSGEIDAESELESLIGTNVYTNNDGSLYDPSVVDNRYVNRAGGTMTGALVIKNGGGLNASGAILTNANLSINSDNGAANAVLSFGNQTAAQTLTYNNLTQRFEFSKDVKVTGNVRATGNISGSTLTVDGAVTLKGITYNAPTNQGANTYLKTDGAGNLTWATVDTANGSGGVLSLHPQYPNAVYAASGSTVIGELTQGADSTNKELYYRWQTDESTLQDYWIWVRVKVPKNFSNWTSAPIQLRYRTLTTSAAVNALTVRLLDTTGASVPVTNGTGLVSSVANTWTTATIGNVNVGTYAPDGYVTVLIKVAATNAGSADAGYLNINWSTTTP